MSVTKNNLKQSKETKSSKLQPGSVNASPVNPAYFCFCDNSQEAKDITTKTPNPLKLFEEEELGLNKGTSGGNLKKKPNQTNKAGPETPEGHFVVILI